MHLHNQGQKNYIKELMKQRDKEIKEIRSSTESNSRIELLIQKIKDKFTKLIEDTDESLFVRKT